MPLAVCGSAVRVVDTPDLKIDELAGNVSTKDDRISIAMVKASAGASEPWLTLHYDEWICVLHGEMKMEVGGGVPDLIATAGQTVLIEKGTRFRPSFPVDCEYVPVCLPAFSPERCVREDATGEQGAIASKLRKLHAAPGQCMAEGAAGENEVPPETLYHMTTVADWEAAKASQSAYYPKTYEADGFFTHATAVPERLISTANHFYQDVQGEWICLQFSRQALRKCGIHVRDEEAMPVGEKGVDSDPTKKGWVCPHVIGGIPLGVVEREFPMVREGPKYLRIEGLTN